MEFKVGETVVYPHHGAALIEDISERIIRGEKRLYLTLRIVQGDLTIQVPADSLEEVGIRNVSDEDRLTEVFAVLREKEIEEPVNWSRRYKANGEKLTSGDVKRVAEVVRDLSRRESVRGLSAGEKRMLSQAMTILAAEVALAREISAGEATVLVERILDGYVPRLHGEDSESGCVGGKKEKDVRPAAAEE